MPEFLWSPAIGVAVAGTAGMLALNRHYKKLRRAPEPVVEAVAPAELPISGPELLDP